MKKLFEEQNVSLYKVQKDLGLSIMRLYRYTEDECNIESMPTSLIFQLSNYFKIEPNILYNKMLKYKQQKY